MAVDTFMVYVGVYGSVSDAEADYELIEDLHTDAGLVDAYDAALIERRPDGKVGITRSTRPRLGSAACWAAAWGWPPAWSWRCSRSRRSPH